MTLRPLAVAAFSILHFSFYISSGAASIAPERTPLSISGFNDSSGHWRNIKGDYFVYATGKNQPRYKENQVAEICANILLFQRNNGGWPKDYDMCAVLTPEQRQKVIATRDKTDTSFDNHNVHAQIEYLAKAYAQTRDEAVRSSCLRGLDFVFAAQYKNGGFSQRYPNRGGYAGHITFNDGVMMGLMGLLDDIAKKKNGFEWLDDATVKKGHAALDNGIRCLLATQYVSKKGILQGWGQQHDEKTLQPTSARTFELTSLCASDTAEVVKFLMKIEKPSPEIIRSIRAAVAWLEATRITGIRVETYTADFAEFRKHDTRNEKRIVEDPSAPPLWARMTELETNRPIFSGHDGVKKYSLAEIDRDRRTGYGWYTPKPEGLLKKDYPAWLKRNNLPN